MLKYRPRVIVVLRSFKQNVLQNGPRWTVRETETADVMEMIGLDYVQWNFDDMRPDWPGISDAVEDIIEQFDTVIAPAWEENGHDDHNELATIAVRLSDDYDFELVRYLTYRRGEGRSTHGVPVDHTVEEELLKLQALSIYESQIGHEPTRAWFPGGAYEMLAEFVATT